MCSVNDDCTFENDNEVAKDKDLVDTTLCRKCKCYNVDILLNGPSGYCTTCFLIVTSHKFRAALGKSKIIRHGDLVLVDHSGDLNSTVLLHLIKDGMSKSAHKKLIFKIIVLYIDEKTNEEKDLLQHKIAEEIKGFGFNGYVVSLSQVLNKEDTLDIKPIDEKLSHENKDQLYKILASLSDNTSKTDLIYQLRRKLLLLVAEKLKCNKIFVVDSAADIAAKVLGDVCLGRGAQLSMQASFCDARCADIMILKPLRDFTKQELVCYSKYHKISSIKSVESNIQATSIQALARNFTTELESQFSGTVSTIFRTADKISLKSNIQQRIEDNCVLCDAKLDCALFNNEISAMRAIKISKLVSSEYVNTNSNNEENGDSNCLESCSDNKKYCNNSIECNCENNIKQQITMEDVLRYLCYSCRRIFQNSEILCTLPPPLLFTIQQRIALNSMREKISDFLL
ncbi:hypothetical protein PUN28_000556 [Cardiocondyla obscurior]|uniref:Cytoplasmic tRNA 2-thiolation protein 2 n=1 Tax=Cardiocondyla obscurior TaxID=286306 RepID=A0AAW2H0G7_9HYME